VLVHTLYDALAPELPIPSPPGGFFSLDALLFVPVFSTTPPPHFVSKEPFRRAGRRFKIKLSMLAAQLEE